ncbi:hypothetical protein Csa_021548, partial [Cucumis sativus]
NCTPWVAHILPTEGYFGKHGKAGLRSFLHGEDHFDTREDENESQELLQFPTPPLRFQ